MNELVFRGDNGTPMTNSYLVAETFGKEHNKVCRDIEKLECSEVFQSANFGVLFKIRELPNGGHKQERYYNITKDGFTFLAMGYTGKKAAEFKEKYIAAFNAMEQQVKQGFQLSSEFIQTQMQMMNQMMQLCTTMQQRMDRLEQNVTSGVGKVGKPKPERKVPWITSKRNRNRPFVNVKEAVLELDSRGVYVSSSALYRYLRSMNYISSDNRIYNRPTPESIRTGLMSFANSGSKILSTNPVTRRRYYTPLLSRKFLELLAKDLDEIAKTNPTAYQLDFKFGKEVQP